ncbi:hypothetical protein [Methanobrevibacter sp. YE315]|uniref:hypothetical protein n=1 Tax=Methanobrevibacter sp. YE315 TaxID=1609968 RepID=UPI0018CC1AF6|nr:hypothetical protein [Methanobrevibacter sp. YE315]
MVLIAFMGIAGVSACDVDNCTANDTAPYDIEQNGIDNSPANATAQNDVNESCAENSSADDEFPYDLEEYGIENFLTDDKKPYNVYEHAYYDEDNNAWVEHDLYYFAGEVIMNFNDEGSVEIFMHELGISEREAWWLYFVVIDYYHIVENIAPPDEYDRLIYYDPWK